MIGQPGLASCLIQQSRPKLAVAAHATIDPGSPRDSRDLPSNQLATALCQLRRQLTRSVLIRNHDHGCITRLQANAKRL